MPGFSGRGEWDRRAMLKPALLLQNAMGLDDMLARDVVGNNAVTKRGRKLVAGIFKLGECHGSTSHITPPKHSIVPA
jgi:hypothetical protein